MTEIIYQALPRKSRPLIRIAITTRRVQKPPSVCSMVPLSLKVYLWVEAPGSRLEGQRTWNQGSTGYLWGPLFPLRIQPATPGSRGE